MAYDIKLFYLLNNLSGKLEIFDWIVVFTVEYLGWFVVVAFLAFLYFSLFSKSEKFRIFLVTIISVVLSRFVITEIIRFIYCRPRPFMIYTLNQLVEDANCSFPSGHAAFFFALAMAIYFYNKKWGWAFFVATILISLSRVVAGVHYPTDIVAGAVMGVISSYLVFYFAKKYLIK